MDEIFGDSDRPATFQDTLEMKYLERCIMETLRMYPPVPIIARQLNEEVKLGKRSIVKFRLLRRSVLGFERSRTSSYRHPSSLLDPELPKL